LNDIDGIKENLTRRLSEQYSKNIIDVGEYERILEYINKIETGKELSRIEKIIRENDTDNNESAITENDYLTTNEYKEKHFSVFSWRTSNVKFKNGNGGKYISLFGTNRIIVDSLPVKKAVLVVESIFGLTEIFVSENIKVINRVVPIFSGIYAPTEINKEKENLPELHIIGKAIFGNITINTM